MDNLKNQIIDFGKIQKLADELGCSRDYIFEWTDLTPMDFMQQVGASVGFDVEAFLKTDIKKLNFKKIVTEDSLLEIFYNLPIEYRSIENAQSLEFGGPFKKRQKLNPRK